MERELIIPVKDLEYNKEQLECEIAMMKKLLPGIESYNAFVKSFEVFDVQHHKPVKKSVTLNHVYMKGVLTGAKYLVVGKN